MKVCEFSHAFFVVQETLHRCHLHESYIDMTFFIVEL